MTTPLQTVSRAELVGFRFSTTDAVALGFGAVLTAVLWQPLGALALVVPWVLGHYFLFCNVVRMRRHYELGWAVFFVVMMLLSGPQPTMIGPMVTSLLLTVLLVVLEVYSPRYHGVFADRLNPVIDEYVARRRAELSPRPAIQRGQATS